MKKYLFMLCLLLLPLSAQAVEEGIAAVVNDSVITSTDVKDRVKLYLSGARGTPTAEDMKKIEQDVLNRLIDESLQLQEAKKLGLTVDDGALAAGFADIAQRNNFSADEFRKRLTASGAPVNSLMNQIRAEMSWSQVVRQKLRPQVQISESEIDLTLSRIATQNGRKEYNVSEIFLAVNAQKDESKVLDEAQSLSAKIAKSGSFSAIARDYSRTTTDIGWVQQGQLDPVLDRALSNMSAGQVSAPLRDDKGYHILFLKDLRRRPTAAPVEDPAAVASTKTGPVVELKQIMIPISMSESRKAIGAKMATARSLQTKIKSCDGMAKEMKNYPSPGTRDLGRGLQNALPDDLRKIVEKLKVGELSPALRSPTGVILLMVCSRGEPSEEATDRMRNPVFNPDDAASRDKIANQIGMQRLSQLADHYLRDLRATAFIDKRL